MKWVEDEQIGADTNDLLVLRENINPLHKSATGLCGGSERIRTAVGAFAELCLAARPRNRI